MLDTVHCIDILHLIPAHAPPSLCLHHPHPTPRAAAPASGRDPDPAERDRMEVFLRSHQGETLRELAADLA